MTEEQTFIAFENTPIRRHFDEATANWYFSIVDVIAVLSESVNPRDYWFRMKVRVKSDDGLELSTTCRWLIRDTQPPDIRKCCDLATHSREGSISIGS